MHDETGAVRQFTRRTMLGAAAAMVATPALSQQCQIGPPKHEKGPLVFRDYDQAELDAAYKQEVCEPLGQRVLDGLYFTGGEARDRIGEPQRVAYGETEVETLDIYRTDTPKAPIFLFIPGGPRR